MTSPTHPSPSISDTVRVAIEDKIPEAIVEVSGSGGHFTISVTSKVFSGLNRLESQRLVYSAIAHLMKGDNAPVHAVDKLETRIPTT